MNKRIFLFLAVIGFVGCRHSAQNSAFLKTSESRPLFGTMVRLDACYENGKKESIRLVFDKVWQRLEEINWRMNVMNEKSDVARINNARQNPVSVGEDTYQLLKDSVHYSKLTKGTFDITVYPLIELWKKSEGNNQIPDTDELRKAKRAVGSSNIEFMQDGRVRLLNGKTKIDLGGIGCGYAADEAKKIFRESGINNFLVDTGGELFASGQNCEGLPWKIGIRNPRDTSRLVDVVELTDAGISTSGNYEHFYEIQNQRWSHIMNPLTGYPQRQVASSTVIAPTATEADALSTALCVLGGQQGIDLINSLGEKRLAVIFEENEKDGLTTYKSIHYDVVRSTGYPKRQ